MNWSCLSCCEPIQTKTCLVRAPGSHWVCYYRNKKERIYFDSYGQITHVEIQRYLKTGSEFDHGKEVNQRNTDIVSCEYASVRSSLLIRVEIINER